MSGLQFLKLYGAILHPYLEGTHPYGVSTYGVQSEHDSWYFGSYGPKGNAKVDHENRDRLLEVAENIPILKGSYMYLGLALAHWGHLAQDVIHKLWLSEVIPHDVQLLVLDTKFEARGPISKWLGEAQSLFKIPKRQITFVNTLTRVEELFVPQPGIVDNVVEQEFAAWAREATNIKPMPDAPKRLIVSRRGYDLQGRLAGSNALIHNLCSQGWFEFQPQRYPLSRQLQLLASADSVIFEEGSSQYLAMFLGRGAPNSFLLKRRDRHSLDNLLDSLEGQSITSAFAKVDQAIGRDANNSLGYLEGGVDNKVVNDLEMFSGCNVSLSDFRKTSWSDLERWRTFTNWSKSGNWHLSEAISLQHRLAELENLGSITWRLSKEKPPLGSGLAFAIDSPQANGNDGVFPDSKFNDLRVRGWLISEPSTSLYFESNDSRINFEPNHDRAAVRDLYLSAGFKNVDARIGFDEVIPWNWNHFTLKAKPKDSNPILLASFSVVQEP